LGKVTKYIVIASIILFSFAVRSTNPMLRQRGL